jgi:hypothetical protein
VSPGHLIAACCFLALAGMRAAEGSWVWAGVFAVAALAQVFLGARFRRAPRTDVGARPRRQASTWRLLTVSSCALSGVLLLVQPALGLVAAIVALYCLRAARIHRTAG